MYFLFIIMVPSLGVLYFVLEDNVDIMQANYNAAFLAETTCFTTKLLPFIQNAQRIKTCIHYFESSNFSAQNQEQKRIIENCVRICRRNSTAFFYFLISGVIVWNIKPLFSKGQKLPVDVWLPFNPTRDPLTFYGVYLFLAIGIIYAAVAGTIIDPLIGGLACHAAGQLKILKNNVECLETSNGEAIKVEVAYGKVKRCIDHHNAILTFVKEYEACFSLAVFSQFAGGVFTICFCCLQLTMMEFLSVNGILSATCIIIVLAQLYFYCYYGTSLLEENNSLSTAIYMGKWYEYDIKSKQGLIVIMERSKRPMVVTVGKILELSLATFAMIMRRTYSLLAVLKNYQ